MAAQVRCSLAFANNIMTTIQCSKLKVPITTNVWHNAIRFRGKRKWEVSQWLSCETLLSKFRNILAEMPHCKSCGIGWVIIAGASIQLSQWCILHIPPFSTKFISSSLFAQNLGFLLNLRYLLPPCFDHDAFMHHALHVLDAPGMSQ